MPLKISRAMTDLLLSFHQIMPSYLDFISVFGLQLDQREVRFSGFHEQSTLDLSQTKRPAVPLLGRSGYGYQLCYNLKAIVDKGDRGGKGGGREWSKRQAAIHHQFDVENGTALWVCTEGRKKDGLFDRIRDLTSDTKRLEDWSYGTKEESFRSSLATHLTCCHWSIEEWRTYMSWLEETVEKEVSKYSSQKQEGATNDGLDPRRDQWQPQPDPRSDSQEVHLRRPSARPELRRSGERSHHDTRSQQRHHEVAQQLLRLLAQE